MTRRTKNISIYAAKSYMVSKFKSPHSDQKGAKSEMALSLVFWLYSLLFLHFVNGVFNIKKFCGWHKISSVIQKNMTRNMTRDDTKNQSSINDENFASIISATASAPAGVAC